MTRGDEALAHKASGLSNKEAAKLMGMSPSSYRRLVSEQKSRINHIPAATTRRCRNKDCIQRFVPVNEQNFYCSPECRNATDTWSAEDILQEEGSLFPEASNLELAKRAYGQKNQVLRRVTQLSSLREYLKYEVSSFYDDNPEYRFAAPGKPIPDDGVRGEREVIVQLGDWQVGKLENGIGIDVMRNERIPRIKQAIRSIVERQRLAGYSVNRVILSWGGDMIEGCYIYGGQNVTGLDRTSNTHRLTTQCRIAAHMTADVAVDVASYVETVDNEAVPGNHGRTNGKNDFSDPTDSFDLMTGDWASDITANYKNIHWNIHENWWGSFESLGNKVVSLHGDQWRGPLQQVENLLPRWLSTDTFGSKPSIVLLHHRHDFAMLRVGGITVCQSGTIDGGSNWYLRQYGKASPPSQTVIVTSEKRPVEAIFPIYF